MDRQLRVFAPGPTALHPRIAAETASALADGILSESHRSARFTREVERTVEALKGLLEVPPDHRILFVSSATEAMERLVAGTSRSRTFHLVNGAFARRFREVATNLGRDAEALEVHDGEGFSGGVPFPEGAELLALTQNETSTGVRIPADQVHLLADAARRAGALSAVDLVTGWPTEEIDPGRIDAGFFSVQKAFGLPAGLGVIVVGPALAERARRLDTEGVRGGGYLHLPALLSAADRNQTVATPNMLAIRLLGRVAEAYLEVGIQRLRDATSTKAELMWEAVGKTGALRPFVVDAEIRSRTVLVVEREDGGSTEAFRKALQEGGFIVGNGYGPWKGRQLRIANFPVQSIESMEALAAAIGTAADTTTEDDG
jgi:phosphoserine aminotransferase